MKIQRSGEVKSAYEYGCDLRRLYPWDGVSNPLWGSAICSIRPGEATQPHAHDEDETFIILRGSGTMLLDADTASVGQGDVIFLPRNSTHSLKNASSEERLEFLTIWWGSPEATARMVEMVEALRVPVKA